MMKAMLKLTLNKFLRLFGLAAMLMVLSSNSGVVHAGSYGEKERSDIVSELTREWLKSRQVQAPRQSVNQSWSKPISTTATTSWHLRGTAKAVLVTGDIVYVGGDFTEVYNDEGGSLPRNYVAALNRFNGKPTNFAPTLDDKVFALAMSPDKKILYVGGSFLTAQGRNRARIAAYNVMTGALTSFVTPPIRGAVRAIAVDDDKVYVGGLFTRVGSSNRPYLAAFDRATGKLDRKFTASPNGRVTALVSGIDRLWAGGDFTRIDGVRQKGVAAIDPGNGSLQATDEVDYKVTALAASDTQLFVAGGGRGGRATALNRATGLEQWEISSNGNFQAVSVGEGPYVYFGGHYEAIAGNKSVDRLTRHDKTTGQTDLSWLPRINGIRSIDAIDVAPNGLYIGGDFTRVGSSAHEGFAIMPGQTNAMDAGLPLTVASNVRRAVDSDKIAGPRWIRLNFDAAATATHTIRISWDSGADLRFNVFEANGTRINSSTVKGSNPGFWRGKLRANKQYYVGLWSHEGIANYTTRLRVLQPQ